MTRRYYICDLVQDERKRWIPNIVASSVTKQSGQSVTVITGDFTNGIPDIPWCLCIVETPDHATLGAIAGVDLLPSVNLVTRISNMSAATKNNIRNRLVNRGIDPNTLDLADSFRDVIIAICKLRLNNAGFDVDRFDA